MAMAVRLAMAVRMGSVFSVPDHNHHGISSNADVDRAD
jgi:hypothetical protein